ncbi:MAG: GNAT family N-acetyltransferase [Solirubrobacteraceae bacterium]
MTDLPDIRIQTPRLLLRPMTVRDLDDVLELHREPTIIEFLGSTTPDLARERLELCEENWRERGHDLMAVLERSSGRFLGRMGLRFWPELGETEAGWALRRQAWGQGYATEAARTVIDWGFRTLPLGYVTAMIRPDNSRSLSVARRLAMQPIRDDVMFEIPVIVHAIDRERWGVGEGRDEIERLLGDIARWARSQEDLVAVALVGSRARQSPRLDSDVDLVFLSRDPARYLQQEDWAHELGAPAVQGSAWRGALMEQRLRMTSGLELDVAIGSPSWATVDPVDSGTARVVREGCRIIHDPQGVLGRLRAAVA